MSLNVSVTKVHLTSDQWSQNLQASLNRAMATTAGSGTLSDVYASAQRLRLELSSGIEQLERAESMSQSDPLRGTPDYGVANGSMASAVSVNMTGEMAQQLRSKLHDLQRCCAEMENLWRGHYNRAQRDLWKRYASRNHGTLLTDMTVQT